MEIISRKLIVVLSLLFVLNGCAYYSVKKTPTETTVKAISWRQMDAPFIDYYRDGEDKAGFTFSAEAVLAPTLKDLGDAAGTVLNVMAYCKAYPAMCTQ
jgi:hypothetical protein